MTEPRGTRRRRRADHDDIPADLRKWFAGERTEGTPWSALIYPDSVLLWERWKVWVQDHPKSRPPTGFEWIANPPPERMHGQPYAEAVRQARKCEARGGRTR